MSSPISIHVSTKRRRLCHTSGKRLSRFQSTSLRRDDVRTTGIAWAYLRFQSTSLRRDDKILSIHANMILISIHVSTKRRPWLWWMTTISFQFQSTSLRRDDSIRIPFQSSHPYFNPRLYEETTCYNCIYICCWRFQSTSLRRDDLDWTCGTSSQWFQSTSLRRDD